MLHVRCCPHAAVHYYTGIDGGRHRYSRKVKNDVHDVLPIRAAEHEYEEEEDDDEDNEDIEEDDDDENDEDDEGDDEEEKLLS